MNTAETHTSPRIMVIDDSQTTRNLAVAYLRHFGPQAVTAASAEEGLALMRIHRPDLVLCDVVLPGLNGFSFVAALRSDPDLARTLVVLMSAVSAMQERLRGGVRCGRFADQALRQGRACRTGQGTAAPESTGRCLAPGPQLRERMYLMSILFYGGQSAPRES
jgi:CheY-like chemotaxis protein